MAVSPFTFYRGAAIVMAEDLAGTPVSGITVQLGGDAHLSNFGLFASPERDLVFDMNDFDETLPGPWEWDVKRLAASIVVAARSRGATPADAHHAAVVHRARLSAPHGGVRADARAGHLLCARGRERDHGGRAQGKPRVRDLHRARSRPP